MICGLRFKYRITFHAWKKARRSAARLAADCLVCPVSIDYGSELVHANPAFDPPGSVN